MKFSPRCVAVILLAASGGGGGGACHAFVSPSTTAASRISMAVMDPPSLAARAGAGAKEKKPSAAAGSKLRYVRHDDDGLGWVPPERLRFQRSSVHLMPQRSARRSSRDAHRRNHHHHHQQQQQQQQHDDENQGMRGGHSQDFLRMRYEQYQAQLLQEQSESSPLPAPLGGSQNSLDYEDRINARFSRHRRRERLRATMTYGAELDLERREMEERRAREAEEQRRRLEEEAEEERRRMEEYELQMGPSLVNTPMPIINFRTNSDFPASELPTSQWMEVARPPLPFDDAAYSSCHRAPTATRVLIPCDDYYLTSLAAAGDGDGRRQPRQTVVFGGREYLIHAIEEGGVLIPHDAGGDGEAASSDRAYWLQSKLHDAIYGQVRYGTALRRLDQSLQIMSPNSENGSITLNSDNSAGGGRQEWISVEYVVDSSLAAGVAIKEMSWEHIEAQREQLAEDPIKEVAAMQYLQGWVERDSAARRRGGAMNMFETSDGSDDDESHIMMPLDLLSDEESLYSITPYCAGGRLLDIIESKSRFSEPEARYWMHQILKGVSVLKKAGVVHRDMSPENLMVHDGKVYIIDLGMCLRTPPLHNRGMKGQQQRAMIVPHSPCGKWYYLSPEVCLSEQPFDGPTVDLWACGVILFIMLTGMPPWEEPRMSDENFKLMSTGHLVRILTERRTGLSVDAMDLLQRMFWVDPADRLSLEQVMAHPWMNHN